MRCRLRSACADRKRKHCEIQAWTLRPPFFFSNRYRKNGPPTNDMIIPAGSSNGEKSIRPSRSHNSTKLPPKSAEHGKRKRGIIAKKPPADMRDDQSDKAEQTGETDDTSGKDACEGQKQKAGE